MNSRIPRILIDAHAKGTWKQVPPGVLRRCLGDDLDDLELFESVDVMFQISSQLDKAGYVDDPEFCMRRDHDSDGRDERLDFSHALFLGGAIVPGDDVFIAIIRSSFEDDDPPALVFDWQKSIPRRWTVRGKLSELIEGVR